METALRAMDLVMDDRPQDAQKLLDGGSSSYHKVRRTGEEVNRNNDETDFLSDQSLQNERFRNILKNSEKTNWNS